jgi:hypothetical protein
MNIITKIINTFKTPKLEIQNTDFFTKPYFLLGSCRTGKTSLFLRKTWHDLDVDCKIYVGRGCDTDGWKHTHRLMFTPYGLSQLQDILNLQGRKSIILHHNIVESETSIAAGIELVNIISNATDKIRLILDEPSAYMSDILMMFIQNHDDNVTLNYTYQSISQMIQHGFKKLPIDNIIITGVVDYTSVKHIKAVLLPNVTLSQYELKCSTVGNYHAIFDDKYCTGKLTHAISG